jgi:hypothetical protein
MPEETQSESTQTKTVEVEKPQKTDTFTFKKAKVFTYSLIALMIGVVGVGAAYSVGYDSGSNANKSTIQSKKETSKETKKEEGVIEAELGESVKVKNGITIKLEEANFDQAYEKEKDEQRKYYENATYSAYLESDYFKTSHLKLKVSLNNTGAVALPYNLGDFRLKDSDDVQYVYSSGEQKQIYNLNPLETTKITISYYVPSDEDSFELIFDNAVVSFKIK